MVVAVSAVLTMISSETVTWVAQRGSVPPAGQLLPAAAEAAVLDKMWSSVSGLSTVTE